MPRSKSNIPISVLAVLALLAFSWPIFHALLNPGQICTDDLSVHIHKAYALERLIQTGHLLPRWSPDLARGYGYPLFNFYAPLSSYPLAALSLLGFAYPFAVQLTLAFFVWLAGFGMYLCARNMFGPLPALVAAVAYVYAPYLGYDVFFRGALAEVLAWVWIPFCLWALRLATQRASWRWTVFAAICYGALPPSHNLVALLVTPLLIAWGIVVTLETKTLNRLCYSAAALVLGLALSAAFWLPALAERDLVRTDRLLESPLLQYQTNFIELKELLAPPLTLDPALLNPSPPRTLGLLTGLLALPGLLALGRRHSARLLIIVLTLSGLAYSFGTLALSQPLWETIPLVRFVQFPWRLLTPAAACAALLIAAGISLWDRTVWMLTLVACSLLASLHLAWFTPTLCAPEPDLRAATFAEGSFAYSEYLPDTVLSFPTDDSVYTALSQGQTPDRLHLAGSVQPQRLDPLDASYSVSLSQPTPAVYQQFFYPGWQVTLNNKPLELQLAEDGLIRFTVPAGQHTLQIKFGETPLRLAGDSISVVALLGLSLLLIRSTPQSNLAVLHSPKTSATPIQLLAVGLIGLAVSLFNLNLHPLQQTRFDGKALTNVPPLRASFAGGLELYGVELPMVRSDDSFDLKLYVGVREKTLQRLVPALTIEDESGLRWSDPNIDFSRWLRPPFTADGWEPGRYALWARRLRLLAGTPPGQYTVWLTVYDADTQAIASLLDSAGNPQSPRLSLGTLIVEPPLSIDRPNSGPNAIPLSDALTLQTFTVDRSEARPGDTLTLSLLWQATQKPNGSEAALIELLNESGSVALTQTVTPAGDSWPTTRWQPGDLWRGQFFVRLPADLVEGIYHWRIRLRDQTPNLVQGSLAITAPQRRFDRPTFESRVDAQLGNFATLVGYSLSANSRPGEIVDLTLVWQATATPAESYSVFVHIGAADGKVWTQSDGLPQNWSRPTTGWLPGEYIVDEHLLNLPIDLPVGDYPIYVGLAAVATGERAAVKGSGATSDNRIEIGILRVGK